MLIGELAIPYSVCISSYYINKGGGSSQKIKIFQLKINIKNTKIYKDYGKIRINDIDLIGYQYILTCETLVFLGNLKVYYAFLCFLNNLQK